MKGIAYLNMHKGGGNNTVVTLIRHLRGANYAPKLEEKCRAKFSNEKMYHCLYDTSTVCQATKFVAPQGCISQKKGNCLTNNIWSSFILKKRERLLKGPAHM